MATAKEEFHAILEVSLFVGEWINCSSQMNRSLQSMSVKAGTFIRVSSILFDKWTFYWHQVAVWPDRKKSWKILWFSYMQISRYNKVFQFCSCSCILLFSAHLWTVLGLFWLEEVPLSCPLDLDGVFFEKMSANMRLLWSSQDLPGALDDASVTEALNLHKIKNRQWAIFKTSALKGEGLFEGLDWWVGPLSSYKVTPETTPVLTIFN